jgi:hypothetical protein
MPPRSEELSNQYESTVKVLAVTNVYTEDAYRTLKSDFSQTGMFGDSGRWGQWEIEDSIWFPHLNRVYFFLVNRSSANEHRQPAWNPESSRV